jgi:hypothetical protein
VGALGGGEVRVTILGRGGGATDCLIGGAARDRGLDAAVKFVGGGGATWRLGVRAGSAAAGIFSLERGMLRGGGAKNLPRPPPVACPGRRVMTDREGKGEVFRYKSGRFCFGPSASSTPKSTLAVGLPY